MSELSSCSQGVTHFLKLHPELNLNPVEGKINLMEVWGRRSATQWLIDLLAVTLAQLLASYNVVIGAS